MVQDVFVSGHTRGLYLDQHGLFLKEAFRYGVVDQLPCIVDGLDGDLAAGDFRKTPAQTNTAASLPSSLSLHLIVPRGPLRPKDCAIHTQMD